MDSIATSAPAKAILFGEHAVNRGQAAIAVSVGLRTRCIVRTGGNVYHLQSAGHARTFTYDEVVALGEQVDAWREAQAYQAIRELAASDYYAPAKYLIAQSMRACADLSHGLDITYKSEIPNSGGLGSGGAANVALAKALAELAPTPLAPTLSQRERALDKQIGEWAYLGDVIAHGGIASALDTQTSLLGGAIR